MRYRQDEIIRWDRGERSSHSYNLLLQDEGCLLLKYMEVLELSTPDPWSYENKTQRDKVGCHSRDWTEFLSRGGSGELGASKQSLGAILEVERFRVTVI